MRILLIVLISCFRLSIFLFNFLLSFLMSFNLLVALTSCSDIEVGFFMVVVNLRLSRTLVPIGLSDLVLRYLFGGSSVRGLLH